MATNPDPPAVMKTTAAPTNKAIAATGGSAFGAAVATLILYFVDPGDHLPATVSAAITTIVTAIVTLAAAYYTPPGVSEAVVVDAAGKVRTARTSR